MSKPKRGSVDLGTTRPQKVGGHGEMQPERRATAANTPNIDLIEIMEPEGSLFDYHALEAKQ